MYAIVEIAGQQFKVEKDQQIFVHRLDNEEGSKVEFDKVLLIDNGGKVNVGAPAISGAKVTAKVLGHMKGDKVVVFKKKRRKGYKVKNGHRQSFSQIEIQSIVEKGATAKKAAPKAEAKPVAKKATAAKKDAAPKKATAAKTTAKKDAAPKKAAAAKPKAAAKKPAAKKATTAKKTAAKKTDK
ncbi:50S ribosomal protein L21 [Flavobacteriales bacterium]|jgi:large subunit ribosomal protein L21|nr:50S ribosomal protein L21 [Flavobacteriales bacterium]